MTQTHPQGPIQQEIRRKSIGSNRNSIESMSVQTESNKNTARILQEHDRDLLGFKMNRNPMNFWSVFFSLLSYFSIAIKITPTNAPSIPMISTDET